MNKKNVEKFQNSDFDSFFELMSESFPTIERRSYENQKELLYEDLYNIVINKDKDHNINGFIANWQFNDFNFIEHFAVDIKKRGHGLGTSMLKEYLDKCDKPIFLEVELPKDNMSKRRIKFYKQFGFYLNDFDYVQPPMQKQHDFLPLKVMSYPKPANEAEFIKFKNIVYDRVYKINN